MYNTEKLKKLRKKHKYTIYDMGRMLKIAPNFYSLIENKKRRLYYDTSIKIADIFNMKPDEIFLKENSRK